MTPNPNSSHRSPHSDRAAASQACPSFHRRRLPGTSSLPLPRHFLLSVAAQVLPPFHWPLSTTARVSLIGERGDAAQQPRCRGWFTHWHARACFDARRFVELAGPRRTRGLHRVCGGGATRRSRVSGFQEGGGADSSRSSRVTKRSCRAQARPRRPTMTRS